MINWDSLKERKRQGRKRWDYVLYRGLLPSHLALDLPALPQHPIQSNKGKHIYDTKLTQSGSNLSHFIYDTKVFQILYSTYHELNEEPCFFIFLLTQVFNLLSSVYFKNSITLKLHFGWSTFFCLLDHA